MGVIKGQIMVDSIL